MLSIILPVKNEPYLFTLLSELNTTLKFPFEVKVQTEKGLGYAVMCGIKQAKGDIIAICDADGSHPIQAIPAMVNLLRTSDIVIGSRYVRGGTTQDSFSRKIISRIYCKFAQTLFGLTIKDNMSGFIVAKKEVFETYPIGNKGFKFGLELLCKSKHQYKATEYPISFSKRKLGKSKASPMEAIHTFIFMLQLYAKK